MCSEPVNPTPTGSPPAFGSRWRRRFRLAVRLSEGVLVAAALVAIGGCAVALLILATNPELGETWTSGLRPPLFYRDLDADLLEDYAGTFVIGHNSGDTVPTALEALGYEADVIEVDVISINGVLCAGHDRPSFGTGDRFFRGPTLDRIRVATGGARAIKLDLKESGSAYTDQVISFVLEHRGPRRVVVVSNDPNLLRRFANEAPEVSRLLSVNNQTRFESLVNDPELITLVDGVSVYHQVLTEERMDWLAAHNLLSFAWTVNNLERVNKLVMLGVRSITTDNLAIMRLLGGRLGDEPRLERLSTETPTAND